MIPPNEVTKYCINLCKEHFASINPYLEPINIKEGTEDLSALVDTASVIVYSDFDEVANLDTQKRALEIPCSIYLTCTSRSFENAADSFNEAINMAINILKLVTSNNRPLLKNVNGAKENIWLQLQNIPISILSKTADGSSVVCNFKYNLEKI
jgi:hypothetical protein